MEFIELLNILDASDLQREVILFDDADAITYRNVTEETVTVTVNEEDYNELFQVCFVEEENSVKLYLNSVTRFKFDKFDLEDVLSFSIS